MWFLCWERLLSHGYECAAHPCTGHWDAWAPSGEGSCGMKSWEWLWQLKQFQGLKSVQDGTFFLCLALYYVHPWTLAGSWNLMGIHQGIALPPHCHLWESGYPRWLCMMGWCRKKGVKGWKGMRSEVRSRGRSFILRSMQTFSSIYMSICMRKSFACFCVLAFYVFSSKGQELVMFNNCINHLSSIFSTGQEKTSPIKRFWISRPWTCLGPWCLASTGSI